MRSQDGELLTVDPSKIGSLSAYTKEEIALTKGDWIRITRNNKALGVANGERYRVEQITGDAVVLNNGAALPRGERLHLQYGYAATIHSAQGLTSNRVIIDADTKSLTSNRAVFYVAISRPRFNLAIYTDDKKALSQVMSREPKKYAALELRGTDLEKKMVAAQLQRQTLMKAMRPTQKQPPTLKPTRQR